MGEKKEKNPYVPASKVIYNNNLLEQVYNPHSKKSHYLRWIDEEEKIMEMNEVKWSDDLINVPMLDELLHKNVILLPTDAIDYGTVEDLEFEINAFIEVWLDVSEEHRQKATWYIMLTWVIDNLHTIPYLRALGDYGTGKTRYLDVIGGICYKPMFVGGAVRSAPIFRVIDKWRGTAVFDEFTLGKSDETEDIIQILNNGYQRGKPVLRCAEGSFKVKAFDPFGAKILATRKEFRDKALESRCITEIMKLTPRSDVPIDLTEKFFKTRNELQNKLLMYRFKNWKEIKLDETIKIDFGDVLPRIKQSLSPFTALFQYDEKRLNNFIEYTKEYNRKIVEENSTSFDGQIVNAYINLLDSHNEDQDTLDDYNEPHITASKIREFLINDGWSEDKINNRTIGRHMKALGFDSNLIRLGGKVIKVLEIEEEPFRMLKMKFDVTKVTNVT